MSDKNRLLHYVEMLGDTPPDERQWALIREAIEWEEDFVLSNSATSTWDKSPFDTTIGKMPSLSGDLNLHEIVDMEATVPDKIGNIRVPIETPAPIKRTTNDSDNTGK